MTERRLSGPARQIVNLLARYPDGLSLAQLTQYAGARFRGLPAARVPLLASEAITAGAITEDRGRLRAASPDSDPPETGPVLDQVPSRPLRAVIVDLESVVRTIATEPYTDKRIYQIGAVRAGADLAWVGAVTPFTRWLELPDYEWVIVSDRVRAEHAAHAVPPAEALAALLAFADDADVVVAYNGFSADFPLLAEACDREGLQTLPGKYVDAYYLTLAVWPTAPTHRLAHLAAAVGVPTGDLTWHDATADCVLLARLLAAAAAELRGWPRPLRDLIASAVPESPGWRLLRELAASGLPVEQERVHRHGDVAAVAQAGLAGHRPRRPATGPTGYGPLNVGAELRGADGRIDPGALVNLAYGAAARRTAQEQMTTTLLRWANDGHPGLIEAPTGTGKSLAVLAAALDWLASEPRRTAIVTTYTKQLQAQLARDVAALDAAVPGLLATTDVVKGASNRLSLRALLVALADATALGTRGTRNRFLNRLPFRELLVFLLLRLLAATDRVDGWEAHSVDAVDVPAFFADYAGPALRVWLESLSQASNGEYEASAATPVAAYTDLVSEALAGHRLILANHAMLLAHLDEIGRFGDDTLLVIDEAHQLEDAATSALTTTLDYRAVEDLVAELSGWLGENRGPAEWAAVADAVHNLDVLLDHEQLPKVAGQAFDARSAGVGVLVGSRAVTLASPYVGTAGVPQVRTLATLLTRLAGLCRAMTGALGAFLAANGTALDFFAAERLRTLLAKTAATEAAAAEIVNDIDDVLGPPPWQADGTVQPGGVGPVAGGNLSATTSVLTAVSDADEDHDEDYVSVTDEQADADADAAEAAAGDSDTASGAAAGAGAPVSSVGLTNRVVYAEEIEALRTGLRGYRFRIATSPIELPADPTWQSFLTVFTRTYYVSATLRVAGEWTFLRNRLGIGPAVPALALDTPFNLANQAELICFSDFPSWAEQSEGAMRTTAHQLAGYAAEMIRPVLPPGAEQQPGQRGGFDGGAMVLTTARSTAGGIAEYLAAELRRRADETRVHSTLIVGNQRAVQAFTDQDNGGGLLVGTKGLWQGVDVADADRLRLVWINKLPFAPFAAPVIEARREAVKVRAELLAAEDPDAVAAETYYLPLAALQLRQAVGRLIRSERHRGVIVISDRKLAGTTALRRAYRHTFLGSLDPGLMRRDPETGEPTGGNITTMADGWQRIWAFFARHGLLDPRRAADLSTSEALEAHTLLPQTRRIRSLALTPAQVDELHAAGRLADEVAERAAQVAGLLHLSDDPADLKASQLAAIRAVAEGRNVLGLLPTGFGKSFCYQLPALVLPGVTIVVSPLVALMHDQALELNRSIGGAVRALVAPLRESSSRAGKTEVADQLLGRADHGIRLVYISPERLCQHRFRELVRTAVAAGRIRRIALDEAHTFVQWGDDFRPSFRRVEQFLAELRTEFGLPVTALTATANRAVHAGLREGVFGLSADLPEGGAEELVTVRENPIRPELAIFRRSLAAAGPATVAGLVEEVLDCLDDHAIFYCLTVKEVVRLHAHLRDYLGDAAVRVLRFHGRLTEAEKSAVMTQFREAPRKGEEDFAPLVVVATSAFGLGINRPDIRTVFCVSPPTDLAAMYQQLGRAGRDAAGRRIAGAANPDCDGAPVTQPHDGQHSANTGLALLTSRGLRTVRFMTGQDLPGPLLHRMAQAVLSCSGVLDTAEAAERLVGEDVAAGRLTSQEAGQRRTLDTYTAGVVRALAALAGLGAVTDLGDFPPLAAVKPGELLATDGQGAESATAAERAVVAALLALPGRADNRGQLQRTRLDVAKADAWLAATVPGFRDLAGDPPATWQLLADLHDRGQLDVSAAPSRKLVTGVEVHVSAVPARFGAAVSEKAARAAAEITLLQDFFDDRGTCANRKFADYFGVEVPDACCTTAANRCSACWDFRADWQAGDTEPAAGAAFLTDHPRPAGWRADSAAKARRLDEQVRMLLWAVDRGLSARDVQLALRGQDTWFCAQARRWVLLPTAVVTSRFFGANPSVTLRQVEDALARLGSDGRAVATGRRWRDAGSVAREQHRLARQAASAGAVS
jgi:RecQ family ATP-dependent DNA helicase